MTVKLIPNHKLLYKSLQIFSTRRTVASVTASSHDISNSISNGLDRGIKFYFPWRNHVVKEKTVQEYLQNQIAQLVIENWLFDFNSQTHPSSKYMELDVILGSKQAFKTAVASIFQHNALHSTTSNTLKKQESNSLVSANTTDSPTKKDTIESEDKLSSKDDYNSGDEVKTQSVESVISFVPDLLSVFETQLAEFFETAIKSSKKSNYHLHYELIKIDTPYIETFDVLFGGKRGEDFTGLTRHHVLGLLGTISIPKNNASTQDVESMMVTTFSKNENEIENATKKLSKNAKKVNEMKDFATIRLHVNVAVQGNIIV